MAANDRGLPQEVLFDIIWQDREKPQSQLLYFQPIERMVIRSDHDSAEKFIDYENRHVCKRWLELERSLYDIPLVWYGYFFLGERHKKNGMQSERTFLRRSSTWLLLLGPSKLIAVAMEATYVPSPKA